MLLRYNNEVGSSSYDNSWTRAADLLNPSKGSNSNDHFIPDIPPATSLPRANVATIQRHRLSTMFQSRNSFHLQPEHSHHLPINDYNEEFQYNIPLQEKFHQQKVKNVQEI